MAHIYTLTLSPSLDSATITTQIYPEGKIRCSVPISEPGGGGINVARAIVHLGGKATAIFPVGGAIGKHLIALLSDENVIVDTVNARDWTRQNLHVYVESSSEQYRFVMPGAIITDEEFIQIENKVLSLREGSILVFSGSLPPSIKIEKLTKLISAAQSRGIRCIVDSSGEALSAMLSIGNIELVKPNQKELCALVNRELSQPNDVLIAARELIKTNKAKRVVVSLGPQGALAVDANDSFQVVPPPMKIKSTVGAGDSMLGSMTLKLASNASLLEMTRYGVAAGSAATINEGTCLCSLEDTKKIFKYLSE